jgi:frataxin
MPMTLDESRFTTLAEEMLEQVADTMDDLVGDQVDVDLHGGILTLSLPGGGQYVLNKHAPNRELWLSSPVSGAWHFAYADGDWISTREPRAVLDRLLADELSARLGVRIEF